MSKRFMDAQVDRFKAVLRAAADFETLCATDYVQVKTENSGDAGARIVEELCHALAELRDFEKRTVPDAALRLCPAAVVAERDPDAVTEEVAQELGAEIEPTSEVADETTPETDDLGATGPVDAEGSDAAMAEQPPVPETPADDDAGPGTLAAAEAMREQAERDASDAGKAEMDAENPPTPPVVAEQAAQEAAAADAQSQAASDEDIARQDEEAQA